MNELGPMPVQVGTLVAGKYRVERVIGIGGMGVVVAASHEQIGQRVAIKLVRGPVLNNEDAVTRFLREARAASKLRSEHAARVLDVGMLESGVPYMVMEFLEGRDLAQVLREDGPLGPELVADWVVQACEAVAEAHAVGLVHRDLKPQNLFLARTVGGANLVKVLDFGVSKSIETISGALTSTSSMLGSPLYMAPEQMRSSRDVDARADVWALGVVLFELLTRRWPFEADTLPALCLRVISEPPTSLALLRPDVPRPMVQIVERCLEKDVEKRFANAAELASALEPLAPSGSKATVERACMAIAAGLSPTATAAEPKTGSGTRSRVRSRWAMTPRAWGSGRGRAHLPRTGNRRGAGWWSAAALAAVLVFGASAAWRHRAAHRRFDPQASTFVIPEGPAESSSGEPTVPVATLQRQPPVADPPPAATPTEASIGAEVVSALPRAPPPTMTRTWVAAVPSTDASSNSTTDAGPSVAASSPSVNKPAPLDDDIPSLR